MRMMRELLMEMMIVNGLSLLFIVSSRVIWLLRRLVLTLEARGGFEVRSLFLAETVGRYFEVGGESVLVGSVSWGDLSGGKLSI